MTRSGDVRICSLIRCCLFSMSNAPTGLENREMPAILPQLHSIGYRHKSRQLNLVQSEQLVFVFLDSIHQGWAAGVGYLSYGFIVDFLP